MGLLHHNNGVGRICVVREACCNTGTEHKLSMAYAAGRVVGGDSCWLRLGIVEDDALFLNWSQQVNLLVVY